MKNTFLYFLLLLLTVEQHLAGTEPECEVENCQMCIKYNPKSCSRCKLGYDEDYNESTKETTCERMMVSIIGLAIGLVIAIAIITLCVSYFNSLNSKRKRRWKTKVRKRRKSSLTGEKYRNLENDENMKKQVGSSRKEKSVGRKDNDEIDDRVSEVLDDLQDLIDDELLVKERSASPQPLFAKLSKAGLYVINEEADRFNRESHRRSHATTKGSHLTFNSVVTVKTMDGNQDNFIL